MVKLIIKKDDCDAVVQGSLEEITIEVAIGIGTIYNTFLTAGRPEVAESFRQGLMGLMMHDSPMWQARDGMAVIDMNEKKSDTPADQS